MGVIYPEQTYPFQGKFHKSFTGEIKDGVRSKEGNEDIHPGSHPRIQGVELAEIRIQQVYERCVVLRNAEDENRSHSGENRRGHTQLIGNDEWLKFLKANGAI